MKRAATAIIAALVLAMPVGAETVLVTADRMLDVLSGRIVEQPAILVTDGRVVSVGRQGALAAPAEAIRIDLPGHTLVPGLIDLHTHVTSDPRISGFGFLDYTDSFWTVIGVPNAKAMLDAGFTTIREIGAYNYADVGLKQAIEGGYIPGPRIVPATWYIGATGGHCDDTFLPPSYKATTHGVADGADAVRAKVRELRKYGAEVIKVCATGGVFSRNTEPGQQQMTSAELQAVAEEAHMWGLKVAAHAHGADGIKAAIKAGIDTIEHASFIDDEGLRLAKDRGAVLVMDIFNSEYTQSEGPKNGVLPESLRKDLETAQVQRDGFRKAHAMGVKIAFGSDAGIAPHAQTPKQFAWMIRYGMSPLEAIQAATSVAAAALGREKDVGAIAPGRFADMVAFAGNPLDDPRLLEHARVVIKGGKVVNDRR